MTDKVTKPRFYEVFNKLADHEKEFFISSMEKLREIREKQTLEEGVIKVKGKFVIVENGKGAHALELVTPAATFYLTRGPLKHCQDVLKEIEG